MRNRFVTPETTRLDLTDGDWIEVKARLSYGEQQKLNTAALTRLSTSDGKDTGIELDMARYGIERLLCWIVDWSFTDIRGKSVSVNASSVANLDTDTVAEIEAALGQHIEAQAAAKNGIAPGETGPDPKSS